MPQVKVFFVGKGPHVDWDVRGKGDGKLDGGVTLLLAESADALEGGM